MPGQDLPVELRTDYIPGPGEEITLDGAAWTVETVEQNPEDGNWYLYFQDSVVLLDAQSEDAAIRAAFKYLMTPAS